MSSSEFECIPAIDLKDGKCVRLQEGVASRSTEYGDDPLEVALRWQELGAGWLHLVDLDGAFSGESTHLAIAKSIFYGLKIPVQFGGGLRTLEQIERILDLGASRAIVGTLAVDQPGVVEEILKRRPGKVIVGIDARRGLVALRGWVDQTSLTAVDLALRMKHIGVERVIYTDVTRDGMLRGVNLEETENLARAAGIRVIASGGVAGMEDVKALWEHRGAGIEGVILGRSLYEKKLDFAKLKTMLASW